MNLVEIKFGERWLPDMDLNHDKQIQSLLCYRYTIGQAGASDRLNASPAQSSRRARLFRVARCAVGATRAICRPLNHRAFALQGALN